MELNLFCGCWATASLFTSTFATSPASSHRIASRRTWDLDWGYPQLLIIIGLASHQLLKTRFERSTVNIERTSFVAFPPFQGDVDVAHVWPCLHRPSIFVLIYLLSPKDPSPAACCSLFLSCVQNLFPSPQVILLKTTTPQTCSSGSSEHPSRSNAVSIRYCKPV